MIDTNKERADFEAHYFAENGNRLYCESQWRGWKARAAGAPAAPTGWYELAADGVATLCVDRDDAEKTAANSSKLWPNCGPYRAVQLYTAPPAPTEQWVSVADRPLPACATLDVYGRQYGDHQPGRRVFVTYTGTRPLETTEDEEITHYRERPAPPQGAAKGGEHAKA